MSWHPQRREERFEHRLGRLGGVGRGAVVYHDRLVHITPDRCLHLLQELLEVG